MVFLMVGNDMGKATRNDNHAMYSNAGQLIYTFIVDENMGMAQIANEFGISRRTLYNWFQKPAIREWVVIAEERKEEQANVAGVLAVDDYITGNVCLGEEMDNEYD